MKEFDIIAEQDDCTVVARYEAPERKMEGYQSEANMERELIGMLQSLGYEYVDIKSEKGLIENLRHQLELMNDYEFEGDEWERLFKSEIAKDSLQIEDKTEAIQRNYIVDLELEDGSHKNIKLIDKRNIHNNRVQVMNQYVPEGGTKENRYDVTILVNGLPLVHIELKRRGVSIKEAFNQIERYGRESFWAGSGLFEYVQIFVISNGTQTKYYSNTTRYAHVKAMQKEHQTKVKKECNSFEFTSYWSDQNNKVLPDLRDFAKTFLNRRTLLNVLTRYCVFTVDKNLMVMRPYQIAATERILMRVKQAVETNRYGKGAGGYVWHTTGSGKTLTSFKTAQLAAEMPGIEKVLFVVDRQDLDYQTMREYDNFEKGCANSNSNSGVLLKQLNSTDASKKIIITTIQKMNNLLSKGEDIRVLDKPVVMIFDECHRSQFGDMHDRIVKRFKRYILFGFTGTPIFAKNAPLNRGKHFRTTAQVFCNVEIDSNSNIIVEPEPLHKYTIIDAIRDGNVLQFKVEYVSTMKPKEEMKDEEVWGINEEEALHAPQRREKVVAYILKTYAQKTKRYSMYGMSRLQNVEEVVKRGKNAEEHRMRVGVRGFNGMLAVDSVESAIAYYREFKRQQEGVVGDKRLKVATIFTYGVNDEENEMFIDDENPDDARLLSRDDREALEEAIGDYNEMFGANYSTMGEGFQNYYKDVSLRMKNKELDLLIVVGMFLTGFDAKTLNVLWVDKNLRMHGLLQAFSRTNRILNSVKTYGNIVCFRNLEERVNESIALFSDKDASGVVLIRSFNDYYNGYTDEKNKYHRGYLSMVTELLDKYPLSGMSELISEEGQKDFIKLFGAVLRMQNLLSSFVSAYEGKQVVSDLDMQDYIDWYNDFYDKYTRGDKGERMVVNDDIEFEMELVKQVQMDIDYILMLVAEYHKSQCENKDYVIQIKKALGASPDMRDKRELIEAFVERMTPGGNDIYDQWEAYVNEEKERELKEIVEGERLKEDKTRKFIAQSMERGYVSDIGTALAELLPPMPLIGGKVNREETKQRVLSKLREYVNKFIGLIRG